MTYRKESTMTPQEHLRAERDGWVSLAVSALSRIDNAHGDDYRARLALSAQHIQTALGFEDAARELDRQEP